MFQNQCVDSYIVILLLLTNGLFYLRMAIIGLSYEMLALVSRISTVLSSIWSDVMNAFATGSSFILGGKSIVRQRDFVVVAIKIYNL